MIEKLIQYVQADNIAEYLDEDQLKEIVENASHGYELDENSCEDWIKMNKEAMKMIKASNHNTEYTKSYAHSKVIYPLLASANIQLASRLIPHLARNNKVAECSVLGPDPDGTKDAVDRVGDIITVYGEHGRTTSNAANRALQELIELNKTGNAKSQEQVDALEEIAQTQGPDGTYTGGEAHDATGSVDTTNATDLLAKIEAIVNRIKNLDYDFTVGYGTSDLIWTIPTPIGEKVINLTAFATFFLICRSLILAQLSISFVFSIVTTMKGAFS